LDAARKPPTNSMCLDAARKAPPNPTDIIILDEDMTIETDTDPNVLQKKFPTNSSVLQSRKRAATDDHKEFVNVNMMDRLG